MLTALGYDRQGWFLRTSSGKVVVVDFLNDDKKWNAIDPDREFRGRFPNEGLACEFVYRQCERVGLCRYFFDRDEHGREKFNERRFNETTFFPNVDRGYFSELFQENYTLCANGFIRFDRDHLEIPGPVAKKLGKMPPDLAKGFIALLRRYRYDKTAAEQDFRDAICDTMIWLPDGNFECNNP